MRTYSAALNEGEWSEPEFRKAEFPRHLRIGEPKAKTELTIYVEERKWIIRTQVWILKPAMNQWN